MDLPSNFPKSTASPSFTSSPFLTTCTEGIKINFLHKLAKVHFWKRTMNEISLKVVHASSSKGPCLKRFKSRDYSRILRFGVDTSIVGIKIVKSYKYLG
jgi:hypothetical protein